MVCVLLLHREHCAALQLAVALPAPLCMVQQYHRCIVMHMSWHMEWMSVAVVT